ncbi:MAG: hypothetical protein V4443_00110 [Pseudomonadota bacterium]
MEAEETAYLAGAKYAELLQEIYGANIWMRKDHPQTKISENDYRFLKDKYGEVTQAMTDAYLQGFNAVMERGNKPDQGTR